MENKSYRIVYEGVNKPEVASRIMSNLHNIIGH